jgi:hypothetical protein
LQWGFVLSNFAFAILPPSYIFLQCGRNNPASTWLLSIRP